MKASSNSGGIKNMLLQHVEKIVLGVAVILVALFLWSAMGVKPIDASKAPEKLLAAANSEKQRIETSELPKEGVPVAIERSKPTVRLTAPQDGARYSAGDQIVLGAEASGPQGVLGVEFYVDEVRVAVAYAAPYVAVWAATPGEHSITAVAKSPANSSARSAPVTIQVGPAAPPTNPTSRSRTSIAPSPTVPLAPASTPTSATRISASKR